MVLAKQFVINIVAATGAMKATIPSTIFILAFCLMGLSASAAPPLDSSFVNYTGKYVFAQGSIVAEAVVAIENGGLQISSHAGVATLSRIDRDLFSLVEYDGTAEFYRNATGKITAIRILVHPLDLTGSRQQSQIQLIHPLRMLPATMSHGY